MTSVGHRVWYAYLFPIFILLLAAVALFVKLGSAPLQDYDEATYAQVAHEERTQGHVVTLTYFNRPYLEKPPLYFWLAGVSSEIFGEFLFSLRLPSALAGIALIVVTMLLAGELGGYGAAVLTGVVLLTIGPLLDTARQVRVDVLVTLWITLATYGFLRGLRNERWFLMFGVGLGLAIMTKSVIGAFAIVAVLSFALWQKRIGWLRSGYFWASVALAVLIAAPWHIIETLRFGPSFWREYIGYNVTDRLTENLFANNATDGQYVRYLGSYVTPWIGLLMGGLVGMAAFWRELTPLRRNILSCLVIVACIGLVFWTASTKAPTYLIPLYPFIAMLVALGIQEVLNHMEGFERKVAICLISLLFCWGGIAAAQFVLHLGPYFRYTDELAREELSVATVFNTLPQTSDWYTFRDSEVGAIMYMTQKMPLALLPVTPVPGSVILIYTSGYEDLRNTYPSLSITPLYQGPLISLLKVRS